MFPSTKTDIAKEAASYAVAEGVKRVLARQLDDHSEINTDNFAVGVGLYAVGHLVAGRVRPLTDSAVDTVIERYKSWTNRNNKPVE